MGNELARKENCIHAWCVGKKFKDCFGGQKGPKSMDRNGDECINKSSTIHSFIHGEAEIELEKKED